MPAPQPLLFIVHPGSACGSADMNLGRDAAGFLRAQMQLLIESWEGGVVVIDGEISDELTEGYGRSSWRELGVAIEEALARAAQSNQLSVRIRGDDSEEFDQDDAARKVVAEHGLAPASVDITLTGAWVEDDGSGCVNSVRAVLAGLGFTPDVSDAMDLDYNNGEEDEEEMEDEAPALVAPSTASKPRAPGRK